MLLTSVGNCLPSLKAISPFSAKTYLYFSNMLPPPNCSLSLIKSDPPITAMSNSFLTVSSRNFSMFCLIG